MTATLAYRSNPNANARPQRSPPHRQIKVSSRLAPQIYLGHISQPADTSAARPVVVKCAGQLQRQGPWTEWQAARHLRRVAHPNVVRVFDAFVQRSLVFVVMEHCARGDLLSHLVATQPESRLEQHHALRIVRQLANGLHFLHDKCNIAHRDVSLENVFVTRDGGYKLGDFGLCTRADARASGCVGKKQYVAPEVVSESSYNPVTADVWSLGILLFMLLTGAPLLEFASPTSADFQRIKAQGCCGVLEAWHMDRQLSVETKDLLAKMLEFEPRKRLQNMTQVLEHPALLGVENR
ncbi:hypothetical protein PRNP1_004335 [Phytophthora ramorum]